MFKVTILPKEEAVYQKFVDNQEEIARILGIDACEFDIYHPDNCVLATIWSVDDVLLQKQFADVSKEDAKKLLLSLEDVMTETGNEIIAYADTSEIGVAWPD